jgi:hypothetical protein
MLGSKKLAMFLLLKSPASWAAPKIELPSTVSDACNSAL